MKVCTETIGHRADTQNVALLSETVPLACYLSQHPAQEVVMPGEGVPHEHLCSGVGVQEALVRRLEEALVGVEA